MSCLKFRECMVILGLESNAFLADRLFSVGDSDEDGYISFYEFAAILDILTNGTEDERNELSFTLLDQYQTGHIEFEEFYDVIQKIIAQWCQITSSHITAEKESLKEIFNKIDSNNDGFIDLVEYKTALKKNP